MEFPSTVTRVLDDLGIPPGERNDPLEFVLDTGHMVEIRQDAGRWFLCGLLNEIPIEEPDRLLEGLIEAPFNVGDCGCLCHEPAGGRLIYWTEIFPELRESPPRPDVPAFLGEVSEWARKVSQADAL
jgi:hypothetical protein